MDKGDVVRIAATAAVKSILKLFPPETTRIIFRCLETILTNGKWRTKVGVLDALKSFVNSARDEVAAELGNVLPKVEAAMHDTKQEASLQTWSEISQTLMIYDWLGLIRGDQMRHIVVYGPRKP